MRVRLLLSIALLLPACEPALATTFDLRCATARAQMQTDPESVALLEGPAVVPFEVLGVIEVVGASGTIFSTSPTRELVADEMKRRAATLGAHAVIEVRFEGPGVGLWSWSELRGSGYAIRYR